MTHKTPTKPIPVFDSSISSESICLLYPNTGKVEWNEENWKVKTLTTDFKDKYEAKLREQEFA